MKAPRWSVLPACAMASCGAVRTASLPTPSSAPTVPAAALAPCYAHPDMIDPATCVANTLPGLEAELAKLPPGTPAGGKAPTQSAIEALARTFAGAPDGTGTRSERTTYGAAASWMGGGANPVLGSGLAVWLVTVDAPMGVSRAPGDTAAVPSHCTVIMDAANGAVIDSCGGCDTLR